MGFLSSYSPKKRLEISIGGTKFIAEGRVVSHTNYYNCIIYKTLSCSEDCTPSAAQGSSCKTSLRTRMKTGSKTCLETASSASQLLQNGGRSPLRLCENLSRSWRRAANIYIEAVEMSRFPGGSGERLQCRPGHCPVSLQGQIPPVSHGRTGCPRSTWSGRAAEPPFGRATLRQSHPGRSRARCSSKALIAISRHLAFFSVQFISEASIVSEAK